MPLGGFIDEKVEFKSALHREECIKCLNDAMDRGWVIFGGRPVLGHASASHLRARVRISYGNAFQTVLRGRFEECTNGTKIRCGFGLRIFVKCFLTVWFGGIALLGLVGTVYSIGSLFGVVSIGTNDHPLVMAMFACLMISLGAALVAFGRWLARDEQNQLTEFVRGMASAEMISPIPR